MFSPRCSSSSACVAFLLSCAPHCHHPPLPPYFFTSSPLQREGHQGPALMPSYPPATVPLHISAGTLQRESEVAQAERNGLLPPKKTSSPHHPPTVVVTPPNLWRKAIERERCRGKVRGKERASSQRGDSSQGGRKLPTLFFSNPFLISGFGTRRSGGASRSGVREREGERQKGDPGQTKRLAAPRGTIWCQCVHRHHIVHTTEVLEMNSIMRLGQCAFATQ